MSACSTTRGCMVRRVPLRSRFVLVCSPSTDEEPMADTAGGPAAGIRWDLSHLYAGPDDPLIEKHLAGALAAATEFGERYRGRVASLGAAELARALDELEALQEPPARAGSFAGLLFAADTQTQRHGALLQHV